MFCILKDVLKLANSMVTSIQLLRVEQKPNETKPKNIAKTMLSDKF